MSSCPTAIVRVGQFPRIFEPTPCYYNPWKIFAISPLSCFVVGALRIAGTQGAFGDKKYIIDTVGFLSNFLLNTAAYWVASDGVELKDRVHIKRAIWASYLIFPVILLDITNPNFIDSCGEDALLIRVAVVFANTLLLIALTSYANKDTPHLNVVSRQYEQQLIVANMTQTNENEML